MKQKLEPGLLLTADDRRLARALELALARVERDLRDRPTLKTVRKLKLEITFRPDADEAGELDLVALSWAITEAIPKRQARAVVLQPCDGGGFLLNDLAPDNPKQTTLDEVPNYKEAARAQ